MTSIFFSNLFENDTDQFLFGNLVKLPYLQPYSCSKTLNLIFLTENHCLFIVYTRTMTALP